nr:rRNA small subunit methyltransferase 1 [Gammaproteobacteria bacterium]
MSTRERASQSRSEAASGTPSPDSGSGTKTACANAAGTLYVVATPIGNLGDITYRAVEVLGTVDRVLAEDTRRSRRLFDHYGLNTDLVALHEHNETAMVSRVLAWLADGQSLALISDAGTPLINDPGYVVSQAVLAANGRVVPIPGASAVTTALSAAGIATN